MGCAASRVASIGVVGVIDGEVVWGDVGLVVADSVCHVAVAVHVGVVVVVVVVVVLVVVLVVVVVVLCG